MVGRWLRRENLKSIMIAMYLLEFSAFWILYKIKMPKVTNAKSYRWQKIPKTNGLNKAAGGARTLFETKKFDDFVKWFVCNAHFQCCGFPKR